MEINELLENYFLKTIGIRYEYFPEYQYLNVDFVSLIFSNEFSLNLSVNTDTDELLCSIDETISTDCVDGKVIFPELENFYGLYPIFSWIMDNNRGYFDSIQIEFIPEKNIEYILQFKVSASNIEIYSIKKMNPNIKGLPGDKLCIEFGGHIT